MTTPDATPAKKDTAEYEVKDQVSYWSSRWHTGETTWRNQERHLGDEAILSKLQQCLQVPSLDGTLEDARVFVPLCGDTPAIPLLLRLGAHVTGIDCCELATQKLAEECTAVLGITWSTLEANLLVGQNITGKEVVRLYIGDLFVSAQRIPKHSFDLCYDRGSLVAILPEQRQAYAMAVGRLMKWGSIHVSRRHGQLLRGLPPEVWSVHYVESIYRKQSNRNTGPPFHTTLPEVSQLFLNDCVRELSAPSQAEVEGAERLFLDGRIVIYRH